MFIATRKILKEKVLTIVERTIKGKGPRKKKILLGLIGKKKKKPLFDSSKKNTLIFLFFIFVFLP
jgi:hypothetical protein